MVHAILKVTGLFRPVFEWLKIDYPGLIAILEVKLLLDNRRPSFSFRGYKPDKELANSFLTTLGLNLLVGLMYSIFVLFIPVPFIAITITKA